eukprot:m.190482 g.190482  ORF g.190482 m.190482 type:complete len:78 (+) comp14818_c0_seq4:252-485(+)
MNPQAAETVLVHGGSGGVGLATIQLARSRGMIVFATAGTEEGLELCKEAGATHVFNHRKDGYTQEVRALIESVYVRL